MLRVSTVCLTICLLGQIAFGQRNKPLHGLNIKGVRLGSSYSHVIKKLGRPHRLQFEHYPEEKSCLAEEMTDFFLDYGGLGVSLIRFGPTMEPIVLGIEISNENWSVNGVRIGMTLDSVKAVLGPPESTSKGDGDTITLWYDTRRFNGIELEFENGKLLRIGQSELIC